MEQKLLSESVSQAKGPWRNMGYLELIDPWQVLLHVWAPGNPRVWAGLLLFCEKAKGQLRLSTVHRDKDKGRLFELKN